MIRISIPPEDMAILQEDRYTHPLKCNDDKRSTSGCSAMVALLSSTCNKHTFQLNLWTTPNIVQTDFCRPASKRTGASNRYAPKTYSLLTRSTFQFAPHAMTLPTY